MKIIFSYIFMPSSKKVMSQMAQKVMSGFMGSIVDSLPLKNWDIF